MGRVLYTMVDSLSTVLFSFIIWVQDHKSLVLILGVVSVITFFGTLAAIPIMLMRLPADYFSRKRKRPKTGMSVNPVTRILLLIVKNLLGTVVLFAGIAMLVLPGQGILTILVGLMLIDFPGKFQLERRLITQPKVLQAVNQLRRRAGKPELIIH